MSVIDARWAQAFPTLSAAQIATAQRFASGPPLTFAPGALLYAVGQSNAPVYLVLEGSIDALRRDGAGHETAIVSHGPGQLTGETSQLAGRASLAQGVAGPDGCTAAPFDAAHLRALIIGSAEIGEIVMRAYILRRTALISDGGAGSVLIGRPNEQRLSAIQTFLRRNGYPYTVLDPDKDGCGHELVERLGLHDTDLPIVLCPNGTVLRQPTEAEVGVCLGITPELDPAKVYDVIVVGAGPAGLATAVYAASEGLSTLVLDCRAFGGQAGASARIENYFGFPTGISGMALTARAFGQATKFGAEIAIPLEVSALDCGVSPFALTLSDGRALRGRSVVVASGARYRRPDIADLERFEGAGVYYWASPVEARLCEGQEVALVGAGNSAGQAAVFLAAKVKTLHLIVRGRDLESSMSQYLIDRISALPNVQLHLRTEVMTLTGSPTEGLEAVTFRHRDTGETWSRPLHQLFLFIGADPNTDWLASCEVQVDDKGFVTTGQDPRSPLQTNVPGVFAIGDVRAGSTKRVAAAVGEGAAVVAALHGVLAGR